MPTPKASAIPPTELPVQTVDKQVPAHLLLSPQHVKSPVHSIVDHYLETKMSDRTQAVVAPSSKFELLESSWYRIRLMLKICVSV